MVCHTCVKHLQYVYSVIFPDIDFEKEHRKSIKIFKYFKIPKLLRLGRIVKYFQQYAKYQGIMQTAAIFVWALHIGGCTLAFNLSDVYPFVDTTQDISYL